MPVTSEIIIRASLAQARKPRKSQESRVRFIHMMIEEMVPEPVYREVMRNLRMGDIGYQFASFGLSGLVRKNKRLPKALVEMLRRQTGVYILKKPRKIVGKAAYHRFETEMLNYDETTKVIRTNYVKHHGRS